MTGETIDRGRMASDAGTPSLCLEAVSKVYGRHRALIDVNLTCAAGQVTAVLGPNGAGKSTLLGILSTLLSPSSGRVRFGAQDVSRHGHVRTLIGYVGHEPGLYGDLTARQNLALFAGLYGLPDSERPIDSMLERVGLADVRRDAIARTFSRGMQQRLALARALLPEPRILLFDEPSSALDPAGAEWLADEIERERQAGRVVVLVTHDLDAAARAATHLCILRRGRVAFDETRTDKFSATDVRQLYQTRTRAP